MFIVAHCLCECESCRKHPRCGCSCTGCYSSLQQLCRELSQFQLSGATGGAAVLPGLNFSLQCCCALGCWQTFLFHSAESSCCETAQGVRGELLH